jgi:hypothetical protein
MRTSSLDPNGPNSLASFKSTAEHVEAVEHDEAAASDRRLPIEAIARAPIIDEMPMHLADLYGQDDVAVLRGLLHASPTPTSRSTIAALIAIISDGREVDADTLIALARADGEVPTVTAASIIGLGYLAHRGSRHALDFLVAEASGRGPRAEWAVQGLGISGAPGAKPVLERLASSKPAAGRSALATEVLDQALTDHAFVSRYGLRAYYER